MTYSTSRVIIAVLDTGVDSRQPDLAHHLIPGAGFIRGTHSTDDDNGHGTAVARVAVGRDPHTPGLARAVPLPLIMPIKVADAAGHTADVQVARGIRWAVDNGARVINVSLWTADIPQMRGAVAYARRRGVVVVAAAGNGGPTLVAPASYPGVVAVGDVDAPDRHPRSPQASKHLVLAPSRALMPPGTDVHLFEVSGFTSLAAPRVSRLAALLLTLHPDLTPDEVRAAIERGAEPVDGRSVPNHIDGWGKINASRSLRFVDTAPPDLDVRRVAGS